MRKALLTVIFGMVLIISVLAQDQDKEVPNDVTTTEQVEPTMTQRFGFYGLTVAGLIFLFLAYKQSKWGKKK